MSETAQEELKKLLANMDKVGASDMHLKIGSPPIYRVNGMAQRVKGDPLTPEKIQQLITDCLSEDSKKALEKNGSVDFAIGIPKVGRFRVNVYRQRGSISFCARLVKFDIPSMEKLLLPKALADIPKLEDGMVLVVGVTGSGKSTTLASIISMINETRKVHILTIEDPIEFIYRDAKGFINQREIGIDAPDFHTALRGALRQDPDVILVGEMRDAETVETALAASETGHLVFGTLHATNALQTVSRILEFFTPERQPGIRQVISYTLRSVIAQRLVPGIKPGFPRVPAIEYMAVNAVIRKHIADNEDMKIPDAIRAAAKEGMQDFNMSLYRMIKAGLIDPEVAIERSPHPEQLQMQLKGMVLNADQQAL